MNKSAIINAAQKFAAKGQIDKAVSEWEKILQERKDGNVYNTIGDLYIRKGDEKSAAESFTKAAEIFRKDGFYPKAIAIYKKIINIDPGDADALLALAKLNADKGLTGNAIDHYHRAAEIYNKANNVEKASAVAEKMLEIAPADVSTRSKIAYLFFRLGQRTRAANEYASIGSRYLDESNYEKAKEYFDRAIEYDQGNVQALMGLSKWALKQNREDEAFDSLDNALANDPENKELLISYANLAIDSDRKEDAKRALALLIDIDGSCHETKFLLAAFQLSEGNPEGAWEEAAPVIDELIEVEKWSEAEEQLQRFREFLPLPVAERMLAVCRGQGNSGALAGEMQSLASMHEEKGAADEALQLYRELKEMNPDDSATDEKISELEERLGIIHHAAEAVTEISVDTGEQESSFPGLNEISFPEAEPSEQSDAPGMDIQFAGADAGSIDLSGTIDVQGNNDMAEREMTPADEGSISLDPPVEEGIHLTQSDTGERDMSSQALSDDEFLAKKSEADFYAQQGLEEEALKIYEVLRASCPDDQEIAEKYAALQQGSQPQSSPEHIQDIQVESGEETDAQESGVVDNELSALFAQFEPEAGGDVDFESHYVSGLELKQKGLLDEAVKELKIAAGDPDKKTRNATMLAMCYMEKGTYPQAIAEFSKVIDTLPASASTFLHVKYELATAHMQNKDFSKALEIFTEVEHQDASFKDVSEKVESLKTQVQQEPAPRKDRVSYI